MFISVMPKNELIQEFIEIFNELSTDDKVYLHNAFLYESDYDGYTILNNLDGETLDDYLQGLSKAEIKRRNLMVDIIQIKYFSGLMVMGTSLAVIMKKTYHYTMLRYMQSISLRI